MGGNPIIAGGTFNDLEIVYQDNGGNTPFLVANPNIASMAFCTGGGSCPNFTAGYTSPAGILSFEFTGVTDPLTPLVAPTPLVWTVNNLTAANFGAWATAAAANKPQPTFGLIRIDSSCRGCSAWWGTGLDTTTPGPPPSGVPEPGALSLLGLGLLGLGLIRRKRIAA